MKYLLVFLLMFNIALADDDYYEKEHYYSKDLSYLNLNGFQMQIVREIIKEYREDLKEYRRLKNEAYQKKQRLFLSREFDAKKLREINSKLSKKSLQIEESFLKKMHKVLNEQQRLKFVWYIDEWEIE